MSAAKKLVLIVIDGLTPGVFEDAVESGRTPALAFLAGLGSYRRALSTFPSLTPVCASSIATGAHSDVHRIPHLVWYDREERRLVEYGSSFGALVAAGMSRSIVNTIFHMNGRHLGAEAVTVFESPSAPPGRSTVMRPPSAAGSSRETGSTSSSTTSRTTTTPRMRSGRTAPAPSCWTPTPRSGR